MLKKAAHDACAACSEINAHSAQKLLTKHSRSRVVQSFPTEASLVRLVGAVRCEASEECSGRRCMDPSGVEALWERASRPLPDPEPEQVGRARPRIVAFAGLDWLGEAA